MGTRDFRRNYYSTLGFSKVQLEPGVEPLLQKDTIDVATLKEYCLHNTFPSHYRAVIWKILLGVLPPHTRTWDHIIGQYTQIYEDLHRSASFLIAHELLNQNEGSKAHEVVRAYCLYQQLHTPDDAPENEEESSSISVEYLIPVAELFLEGSGNPVDAFWCMKYFLELFQKTYVQTSSVTYRQLNMLSRLLCDKDSQLFKHIASIGASLELVGSRWLQSYFVGCGLKTPVLLAIWDRIACVSPQFVVHIAFFALEEMRMRLLSSTTPKAFEEHLSAVGNLNFETIIKRAASALQ